jgi:phosphoglycolate phosphatase
MSTIRAVLFDLDGTLLDSAPDLVAALNRVRESETLPPLGLAEMASYVSYGAVGLLNAGMPATDKATFESWRTRFLDHYAENLYRESSLYEGVSELIDFLNISAIPWGIVTNKIEALTLPILAAAQLKDTISCVVCGDTLRRSKPDPAPVNLACSILNVPPENTLFAGDDSRDLAAGKAGSFQIHHASELINVVKDSLTRLQ